MREPPRFRDGGDDVLAASLLDAARAYRRPPSTRHRIFKMLGVPIAVSVGTPAAAAIASSLAAKVVALVSAATVVAGGSVIAHQVYARHQAHRAQAAKVSVVAAVPSRRSPVAIPSEIAEPAVEAPLEDPPGAAPPGMPTVRAIRRPTPHRAVAERRRPPTTVAAAPAMREPAVPSHVAARPKAADVAPSPAVAAPAPPPRASLAREIALLDAAERAERGHDYGAALVSLNEYARAFPNGALLAEAHVLRIGALLGNGEDTAAQDEARSFFARYASSPLAARVRSMLSEKSRHRKELP